MSPEKPVYGPGIRKPSDEDRLAQLQRKHEEYGKRVEDIGGGWKRRVDAHYKKLILGEVLELQDGERISMSDLESAARTNLVLGEANIAVMTHLDAFPKAFNVIKDYCETGGADVFGGTGLK